MAVWVRALGRQARGPEFKPQNSYIGRRVNCTELSSDPHTCLPTHTCTHIHVQSPQEEEKRKFQSLGGVDSCLGEASKDSVLRVFPAQWDSGWRGAHSLEI